MQKMKKCYKCKRSRPLAYFGKNRVRKDGLQSSCKDCQSNTNRLYYKNNRKKFMKLVGINKRRRALNNYTRLVTEYLNKPCIDCNKVYHPSSMVFDHLDLKTKSIRKTEGVMYLVRNGYSWKVIKEEVDKCDVRCQNCHFLKTSIDFNHWSEVSQLINDHSRLIKKLYNNGNFLGVGAFNKQKKDISNKFFGFMKDEIEKITKARKSE
jgi:hypothetical protein